ncbi:MAG: 7-cyano-7-deazaguanine/7-aminomethyl-7-deazaguanine transporter [Pseudomonadota bacterium]
MKHNFESAMLWLALLHLIIIASSNYLVQKPFTLFGFHTTYGAFTFPLIYLTTDLTVRLYGRALARKVIACAMFPALLVSYTISVLFQNGEFNGVSALSTFDLFVFRIALASFSAYVVAQLMDIFVFARLRELPQWWIAPASSSIVGNSLDSLIFFSVAFYASTNPYMAEHWLEIAWVDYVIKMLFSVFLMLPMYGAFLAFITRGRMAKAR